jgi:hypothetical protein
MNHEGEFLILEDNADRRVAMRTCVQEHFPQYRLLFFHEPSEFNAHLMQHGRRTVLISLDHDLDLIPQPDGTLRDPGTGMNVVDCLTLQSPSCPVILHTTNLPAAQNMQHRLRKAGWHVTRITPYDDLAWIDDKWLSCVKNRLRAPEAVENVAPRSAKD